jgi:arylsulfatase A-like enzyme
MGLIGFHTPNIDRIAKEGMIFTDCHAEQSCTAGRSTFITGQCTLRTGLSKVVRIVSSTSRCWETARSTKMAGSQRRVTADGVARQAGYRHNAD